MQRAILFIGVIAAAAGCMKPAPAKSPTDDYNNQKGETAEELMITSLPAGASATLSTGESCRTPCRLTKRSDETFSVTVAKDGYNSQTVRVKNNLETLREYNRNRASGSPNLDAIRVNRLRLVPNPVHVTLEPSWSK